MYKNDRLADQPKYQKSKKKVVRKQIRVLAGKYKRQLLTSPWSASCRPTLSRCRQSLFDYICHGRHNGDDQTSDKANNSMTSSLQNNTVMDLYAGSASLAIEAVSRGASLAICVEQDSDCCDIIKENFRSLKRLDALQLERTNVSGWLKRYTIPCDIIFADPPYRNRYITTLWPDYLLPVTIAPWLNDDGLYILQHHKSVDEPADHDSLVFIRKINQGATTFSIYGKKTSDN